MRAAEAPVSAATVPLLMQAINDPNTSIARVAEVVGSDAGLAARVLALANSAAFGLSRQVTEIQQAVGLVGSNMAQTLAIAGSCNLLDGTSGLPHAREHAIRMACATRAVAARAGLSRPDAFAAGLLHDLGEILLWREEPDAYALAHADWDSPAEQLRWERGTFGTDHALAAREQLAQWQLPGQVVDAVGDHHRPDPAHVDLSTCVIAAEELLDPDVDARPTADSARRRVEVLGIGADLDALRAEIDEAAAELGSLFATPV